MNRFLDGVQAVIATGMALKIGYAAFTALVLGLHSGALSVVAAGSIGLLIGWMLFKWGCALAVDVVHPSTLGAE